METALVLIVWGGLVLVGPPALLVWLIRRRRRRERALREGVPPMAAQPPVTDKATSTPPAAATHVNSLTGTPPADTSGEDAPAEQQSEARYMFPLGVPIVLYPILAIALNAVQHRVAGTVLVEVLLLACVFFFTRYAFDRAAFDDARSTIDPTLNLTTWRVNWLLFFALPPALLAVYGAVMFLRG